MGDSVADFSEQWSEYPEPSGWFASEELVQDYFGKLLFLGDLREKRICEVGSGNGRFLKVFSRFAKEVVGIEPSDGMLRSEAYLKGISNIRLLRTSVESVEYRDEFDCVFCLGALHHFADPVRALCIMREMLKPGGQLFLWVYGKERIRLYVLFVSILRLVTVKLPHKVLKFLSKILRYPLELYILLCRHVPLPLSDYCQNVLAPCDAVTKELVIYDQLNPKIARYWSRNELASLLFAAGFANSEIVDRRGYSWTARAVRQ